MKLSVHSLFVKILLWFWATVVVTGIALALTFVFDPHGVPSQWESSLHGAATFSGTIAITASEEGGPKAASDYVERLEKETRLRACLFDQAGAVIAGSGCDTFGDMVSKVVGRQSSVFTMKYGIARIALHLDSAAGRDYIYATELPLGLRAVFRINPLGVILKWCVALLVPGTICYLLTLYIATPILRLREASLRLAAGELSTRATESIESRQDELGDLVRDFNAMAARIEDLVARLRQLIIDMSHELRSPLARLTVALDLGRQRKGNDPAFDHMEQDLALLDNLIERLLTLARLGGASVPVAMATVDLSELVPEIVRNAEFESRSRQGRIQLVATDPTIAPSLASSALAPCVVMGNAPLLYSAIENVIRNAVRYGDCDVPIDVVLKREQRPDAAVVCITVRDAGPGVPESELEKIFQPFYRVAGARDRQSGGAGLGLAIADRVVRIHGGSIQARNVKPRGLEVEILLPAQTGPTTAG